LRPRRDLPATRVGDQVPSTPLFNTSVVPIRCIHHRIRSIPSPARHQLIARSRTRSRTRRRHIPGTTHLLYPDLQILHPHRRPTLGRRPLNTTVLLALGARSTETTATQLGCMGLPPASRPVPSKHSHSRLLSLNFLSCHSSRWDILLLPCTLATMAGTAAVMLAIVST
jgi:hypothetical protein